MMKEGTEQAVLGLNSEEFLEWVDKEVEQPIARGPIGKLLDKILGSFLNWAKRHSIWPLHMGIMCCSIEMAAASDPIYDVERLGVIYRSSPRQIDILLMNGPISKKFESRIVRLYHQIPDPKWVIAMGECTICGGPYYDSYSVIKGAHTVMPVDIYIPGCPPRPEALMDAFLKLKEKIKAEKKGVIKTRKGREVSALEGQRVKPEAELKGLKEGWGNVVKAPAKAEAKSGDK
jgi:NADH-quinone oxidoreductase subunit B